MTELLFQTDSYLKEFEATIINIIEDGIALDKTAFSYRGGGLQSDKGFIETANQKRFEVKEVVFEKGKVIHHLYPEPNKEMLGQKIKGVLDWDFRYKQMRMHTVLHAISSILYKKYNSTVTGGNITPEKSRVDFEIDHLREERVEEITEEIKRIINDDHKVSISFMEREKALKDSDLIRTKVNLIPESVKIIRIVDIADVDKQADGGVHVKSTKEIGTFVPLKSENRGKNNKRLYFTLEN